MHYLDTSAFLKLVVEEEHSRALRRAIGARECWSSTLLAVEAHRAGIRLGLPHDAVESRLAAVTFIVPSETTFDTARTIGPDHLRTLDALHLATATELGSDLDAIVTYDRRLASGAETLGLSVVAPGLADRWWSD